MNQPTSDSRFSAPLSRREVLRRMGGGFGAVALAAMLADQARAESVALDPLAPKLPLISPRAKNVIFLYMTGGVSHVDSFDPKPKLFADNAKTLAVDNFQGKLGAFNMFLKTPQWKFAPGGRCGAQISDLFPHVRDMADELCIIRSMSSDHINHYEATLGMHTGSFSFARPSIGSWVSYGLGTLNQNLPSFVAIAPHPPYAGTQTWGSDFLPGSHQGTRIIPGPVPIANMQPGVKNPALQQMELRMLAQQNAQHLQQRGADAALEARIRSFQTAFGMQQCAPEVFDLSTETDATHRLYGLDRGRTDSFAWQCMVGRRLIERGVRFVELIDTGSSNNWDSHNNMMDHEHLARNVDQPIAGLLADLRQRGLLEETLVVWTTEFGRTPYNAVANHAGREHHHQAFSSWLAGAGVKKGITHGETDEYGVAVTKDKVHVHDFHATILALLGLDHEKLTFRHAGRDYRLTDVYGNVVNDVMA